MPSNASNPTRGCIRVTLLTKPQCGFCDEAKALLSRLAGDYPLVVEMVDLNSPAGERLAISGGILFPPGVVLDDQPFSYGRLSEKKLRRELERRMSGQAVGSQPDKQLLASRPPQPAGPLHGRRAVHS